MLRSAAEQGQIARDGLYGIHWGDPQSAPWLRQVRDRFIYPYLNADHSALEIGPGGGRWTRYLLSFGQVIAVDYHQALLDELARNFRAPHLFLLRNGGADFPGVGDASVDFVFTFGVFVHLDMPIIERYLAEIRRVLKPGANAVVQYGDMTKQAARNDPTFSDNSPAQMRDAVQRTGLCILEEELRSLPNSSVMRVTRGNS